MRTRPAVVHVIGTCNTCGWTTDDYQNGRAKAAQHFRETGHHISVEIGSVYQLKLPEKAPTTCGT